MRRREFIAGTGSVATMSMLGSVPEAHAFWPLLGRLISGFIGSTIASHAMRKALVSVAGARVAARAVQQKTNAHLRSLATKSYPRHELGLSGRFAAYTAGELGSYGGTRAFDHIFRLDETMAGGQEIVASGAENPQVLSFCTGSRPVDVPSLQVNYFLCVSRLGELLRAQGHEPAVVTGLIYPVEIMENNMIEGSWNARHPTVYSTAFGYAAMRPYMDNNGFYACDFKLMDVLSGHKIAMEGVPAARYY